MCHALFLGASRPLPLLSLDDAVWLSVEELPARHEPVRRHFPDGWSVYFVGSHGGCGCGFHSDPDFPDPDDGYDAMSRRALAAYLRAALDGATELALYDRWEGDQGEPPLERRQATPEELAELPSPVPEGAWCQILR